MSTRITILKK